MIPRTRPNLRASELLSIFCTNGTRREFEEAVAAKVGAQYGVAFAYAHAGFFALLKALNLSQVEIVVPAYTCNIMPEVIVATGNIPMFVDINLADFNMDLGALRWAITTKTRAVVATHMFGYPSNVDAIREIADTGQIIIVEDAALSFPDSIGGSGGLRGDVGLFSFGPGKPLFTVRGGVVVTNDAQLYEKLESFRARQMDYLPYKEWAKRVALLMIHYLLSKASIYNLMCRLHLSKASLRDFTARWRPAKKVAQHDPSSLPGDYTTSYANFQARLGLMQLHKSNLILSQCHALAELYDTVLHEIPGLTPAPLVKGASYSLYTVRVNGRDAIQFTQKMRARGIETGRTFSYALPNLKRFRSHAQGLYPCAEQASQEVVNLPIHTDLTEKQICFIADSARRVLRSRD
jgi:perosamine synthetase